MRYANTFLSSIPFNTMKIDSLPQLFIECCHDDFGNVKERVSQYKADITAHLSEKAEHGVQVVLCPDLNPRLKVEDQLRLATFGRCDVVPLGRHLHGGAGASAVATYRLHHALGYPHRAVDI